MNKLKPTIEAVATNAAYVIAGVLNMIMGVIPGAWNIILGLASGYHHSKYTATSRKADYGGMYAVLISISLVYVGLPVWANFLITALLAVGIIRFIGVSPVVVVAGILTNIILIGVLVSALWAYGLSVVMCFAFGFNYLGDNIHRNHHAKFHGIAWHIPTSAVTFTAYYLSLEAGTLL